MTTMTTTSLPLVLQVSPSRAATARDLPALETTMQALAIDERAPIALEIAATATTRRFLLRAEQTMALRYLSRQIQARYPQAVITPQPTDPLTLFPGEACSVGELRPGAASFLPMRTWKPRELLAEGTDPLLGILAACGSLPAGWRAVAQLALLPAAPAWSASSRRYAVEHPLEKERARARQKTPERSIKDVLVLLPFVVLLLFFYEFHGLLPSWLVQAGAALLQGQTPVLTVGQQHEALLLGVGVALVLLLVAFLLVLVLGRLNGSKLYDQRLAEEKTARPAYRVRVRLYVFAPDHAGSSQTPPPPIGLLFHSLRFWDRKSQRSVAFREFKTRYQTWRASRTLLRAGCHERVEMLRLLAAAYRQYHLATGGYFVLRTLAAWKVRRLLAPAARHWWGGRQGWASDLWHSMHLLSVADLAALWHLPQAQDLAELSFVEPARMKTLPVPMVLSVNDGAGYLLGTSIHAGQERPVFLPYACLRQNILAAASTGKGKSTLFGHVLRAYGQGRLSGHLAGGALLVDPHGDLADQVAGSLPPALRDDLVFVRLADRDYPMGFNPLDMSRGADRDKRIDNLIGVVEALWPTSYGPRTESYLEYGCKTLAEANLTLIARDPLQGPDQQFTLLDIVALFSNEALRRAILELVEDSHVKNWWTNYFDRLDGRQQAEFTSSLITKLSKFASSRISRRILGQPRSSLDFGELIRENKIILLSCASGEVGADLAALFGSVFVGFFLTALAEQAILAPNERHRFLVMIDEFQILAGINYQFMLAELRKYGGSFGLATQSLAYLDQFSRTLRATVLANTEHLFAFAMADDDARLLHLPDLEPEDITQLSNYHCYTRLTLGGERLPVFSQRLQPPIADDPQLRQEVIDRSRKRLGHPVGMVEQVLRECEARQRSMKPHAQTQGRKRG